ncbi:MAG: hypothetical protein V3V07_10420 [candidate division NC10 bacterium]|nr:hypothetical protein [candidate division NC10 bacterium]
MRDMVAQEEIQREEEQMRILKWLADATVWRITIGPITRAEGERTIEAARARILNMFPDSAYLFDLILRPRFERLLTEHLEEEFWRKIRG